MMKSKRYKVYPKKTPSKQTLTEPVEVFCRIRPGEPAEEVCVTQESDTVIQLCPPIASQQGGVVKATQHSFCHVFGSESSQKELFDHVGLPLVRDLLHGKNGLIFTYGITGSGKTHTMAGNPEDGGIFQRTLDVIFNSIKEFQARKCTFKSDMQNGFNPQTGRQAASDRQTEKLASVGRTPMKTPRKKLQEIQHRVSDTSRITDIDEDNVFSVFLTYTEIYNNYVYDLLDDNKHTFLTKQLREDANHNMYVEKAVEVEVESSAEALIHLERGQKRRRIAHTQLNSESSRSHTVFTLRVVQTPVDEDGEDVLLDKGAVCISQLSLVDLAGSERTSRTKNTGDRLREAGNINTSLMTLRNCIDILRQNQQTGDTKMVPYRESKVTHLFKNYFDGEGKVKMIICVNPRAGDYEETVHVMKFAEATQEVHINVAAQDRRFEIGLTPGRRRLNQNVKDLLKQLPAVAPLSVCEEVIVPAVPSPPAEEITVASLSILISRLEERKEAKLQRKRTFEQRSAVFREGIHELVVDYTKTKAERDSMLQGLRTNDNKARTLSKENENLKRDNGELEYKLRVLQREKGELQSEMASRDDEILRLKGRMRHHIFEAQEKTEKKVKEKYKQHAKGLKNENKNIRTRLAEIEMMAKGGSTPRRLPLSNSDPSLTSTPASSQEDLKTRRRPPPKVPPKPKEIDELEFFQQMIGGRPVVNLRHRRSRSCDGDKWLEHQTTKPVPLGTVFQPKMKNRRSLTQLNMKDVNTSSKYVLQHQEENTDGELETMLVKGDILPTCGGGSQVVLNDVEVLKQTSPTGGAFRQRSYTNENAVPNGRCHVAFEGHAMAKRARF